ncbi:Acetyltransferase (GNAT) family protein [Amycolatopsis xylanica]|uniref:Acetyltransferase (GNAT) family protein n=1 Tax=Amycolatopsis xylanica TaxID=589385 RepID=A0A1H3JKZ9_9PSEU|nr:GNAT family N-acetyltransferase [Amycolatopsis xylanica]SDY40591.1 Acetyltransferase (GNAT) family protein [Amycolatopsis xylanica]
MDDELPSVAGALIRNPVPGDHPRVLAAMDRWWAGSGGKERALVLPRFYFQHFTGGSELVEHDGTVIAFLIGFLSQSRPGESYVHFSGVSPDYRGRGIAQHLYTRFFAYSVRNGRSVVRAVTPAGNAGSYAFHTGIGFVAEPGPAELDGRPYQPDYDGPGFDRVTFLRRLDDLTA